MGACNRASLLHILLNIYKEPDDMEQFKKVTMFYEKIAMHVIQYFLTKIPQCCLILGSTVH